MRERPILFSGPMVLAILEGRKTQTRRICRGQRELSNIHDFRLDQCPYGQPGDRLWVREAHLLDPPIDGTWPSVGDSFVSIEDIPVRYRRPKHVVYREGHDSPGMWRWRPSIHMPRWASRILLEVTDVRVERLQTISEDDAIAEGVKEDAGGMGWLSTYTAGEIESASARGAFRGLWESINGAGSWDANPLVWAITFRRLEAGHD